MWKRKARSPHGDRSAAAAIAVSADREVITDRKRSSTPRRGRRHAAPQSDQYVNQAHESTRWSMISREMPWRPGDFLPLQTSLTPAWSTPAPMHSTTDPSDQLHAHAALLRDPQSSQRKTHLFARLRGVFTRRHKR
jgi:hypothetical protein